MKVTLATTLVQRFTKTCFEAGVIDPTKVTRVALSENAVSISGMVVTTECVITDIQRRIQCLRLLWEVAWEA